MIGWIRRFRFSMLVQVVIITIGWLTLGDSPERHAVLVEDIGFGWHILTEGRFWHLLTGTWVQSRPGLGWAMVSMCLMVALGTFPLEYTVGSWWTALIVITGDWFATVMTAITLRILAEYGHLTDLSLLARADSGSSALAWAGFGAGAVIVLPRIRWLLIFLVVGLVAWQFTVEAPAPALAHGFAVSYGLIAGWMFAHKSAA